MNGKGNVLWRIVVGIAITIILAAGGWTFSQVRDIPEKYPKKSEIINRLDKFEDKLNERMSSLEQSTNDLRKFLLEYFSSNKDSHSETEEPKN